MPFWIMQSCIYLPVICFGLVQEGKHGSQTKDNKVYLTFTVVFPSEHAKPQHPQMILDVD